MMPGSQNPKTEIYSKRTQTYKKQEEKFTELVKSRRFTRKDSNLTKKGADNNAKTVAVSITKADADQMKQQRLKH